MGVPDQSECFDDPDCGDLAARSQVGALADRPSAAGLPDGVRYFATDDGGGTLWVANSGAWVQAAPAVSGVAHLLDIAEPASDFSTVIGASGTDYRLAPLTVDFTMPAQRVRIDTSEMILTQVLVDTSPTSSLWYSLDSWATKVCLTANLPPMVRGAAPFYLHRMAPYSAFVPTSVAAGESVSVAVFVATETGTPTLMVATEATYGRTTTRRPFIAATAV